MTREWRLQRNCSLSPRQAAAVYGGLCALLLAIGLGFTLHGMWWCWCLPSLEIGVVTLALLHYARHATDLERIAMGEGCLLVERVEAGRRQRIVLDLYWARIVPSGRRALIRLESRGVRVEVGGFVSEAVRRKVAQELQRALRANSCLA